MIFYGFSKVKKCSNFYGVTVVYYEASTHKDMKESDILLAVVETFIWCFVEAFAYIASILNKTGCGHCFGLEVCNTIKIKTIFHFRKHIFN